MHVLVAILVLGILILAHELGHFLSARIAGIKVKEFSVGFGPVIASIAGTETEFTLRILPFGAFVRLAGSNPDEGDMDDPRGFAKKPLLARAGVLAAGSGMNAFLAAVIFAVIAGVIGVASPTMQVGGVVAGYPAQAAGIEAGDVIERVDGGPVSSWEELLDAVGGSLGREVTLTVARDGESLDFRLSPAPHPDDPSRGFLGVSPVAVSRKLPPLEASTLGLRHTGEVCLMWLQGVVLMVMRKIAPDVAGPVGITHLIGQASRTGIGSLLYLSGVLSANLALLNLLPIPALDGSRIMFLLFEAIRGRPLDPRKEGMVHLVGFAMLIALGLLITYNDIVRLGGAS